MIKRRERRVAGESVARFSVISPARSDRWKVTYRGDERVTFFLVDSRRVRLLLSSNFFSNSSAKIDRPRRRLETAKSEKWKKPTAVVDSITRTIRGRTGAFTPREQVNPGRTSRDADARITVSRFSHETSDSFSSGSPPFQRIHSHVRAENTRYAHGRRRHRRAVVTRQILRRRSAIYAVTMEIEEKKKNASPRSSHDESERTYSEVTRKDGTSFLVHSEGPNVCVCVCVWPQSRYPAAKLYDYDRDWPIKFSADFCGKAQDRKFAPKERREPGGYRLSCDPPIPGKVFQ